MIGTGQGETEIPLHSRDQGPPEDGKGVRRVKGVRNVLKNWSYRFQHYAFSISYRVDKGSKFNFFTCSRYPFLCRREVGGQDGKSGWWGRSVPEFLCPRVPHCNTVNSCVFSKNFSAPRVATA
jgi:hypothetical protein